MEIFPMRFSKFAHVLFVICLANTPMAAKAEQIADQIQAIVVSMNGSGSASDSELDTAVLVPSFYELRDFAPAWARSEAVDELLVELEKGLAQGFNPSDFHLPQLYALFKIAQNGNDEDKAKFDVLASDAAVKLIHHVVFGKVDPSNLDSDWNFSKPIIEQDPALVLNEYLAGEGFSALMDRIDIDNAQYTRLVDALGFYRSIVAHGGWSTIPDETVLKPGMVDPAVAQLRDRLAKEDVLQATPGVASSTDDVDPMWIYDAPLQKDVEAFQARHGLEADGVIGGRTFASLNRTAEDRVNQIRLSLERGRWLMRETDEDFILVNIAGARTYLVKSDGTLWATRSITGSEYRKTPVFRDEIKYMEFNPTWTVPASIFRKDKLARIRKDPGYLDRNNYIVRNANGETVPASAVNWNSENPSVTLVQQPGPSNALGLVKFMFPNKYAVYLHDTNDRTLFDRNERNLSSGCVRVEYPFELAGLLMEGDPDWSRAKMQAILDSGKTTRVELPEPMPVLLTYWTAWVEDGVVHFREDPYSRDAPILVALDQ
jgi:murein L,D-transpeptidase YcbB/YkuD